MYDARNASKSNVSTDSSNPEIQKLVKEGKVQEKILSQTEDVDVYGTYEFSSELNFCCDDHLTKDFTVEMGTKPLVFIWSFDKQIWIVEGREEAPTPQ